MKLNKYCLLFLIIILLAVLSVLFGTFQALITGSVIYLLHGLFMWRIEKYKSFIYRELGLPIELQFEDRERFYKDQGVDVKSKVNKFTSSEVFIGIIILVQTLLHFDNFTYKLSTMNAILYGLAIFMVIVLLDYLFEFIARKSKDYSDYYMKFICALIFIIIPFMFFGMIWIFVKK